MKFGSVNLSQAHGAVLAHSIEVGDRVFKKGRMLDEEAIAQMSAAGLDEVIVARLESGDCGEDEAALRIVSALAGEGCTIENPFTGRCNLLSGHAGVFCLDAECIHALNRLDPALCVATLRPYDPVTVGQIVITVKIITFALNEAVLVRAEALLASRNITRVAPYIKRTIGLVSTVFPKTTHKVLNKTKNVLEQRLNACGSRLGSEQRVAHDVPSAASALLSLSVDHDGIVIFGASAIVDPEDVIPAAVRAAGGEVTCFGMPVDPGNLLLIGTLKDCPVIGAPGCSRSPKENGFDWVLQRTLADVPVTPQDVQLMGVGGLLKEISSRPQPRRPQRTKPSVTKSKIAGVILAAGQSRRMGAANKLLSKLKGKSFIQLIVENAIAAGLDDIIVVTGFEADRIQAELSGFDVTFAHNQQFAEGLSSSLKTGIEALDPKIDAALILLSDMPFITAEIIKTVATSYSSRHDERILVPHFKGRRGNPVLWSRRYFQELVSLSGDQGARALLQAYPEAIFEIDLGEEILIDIDTPESATAIGAELSSFNPREEKAQDDT